MKVWKGTVIDASCRYRVDLVLLLPKIVAKDIQHQRLWSGQKLYANASTVIEA